MRGLGGAAHATLPKTRRKVSVVDTGVHRFNEAYIEFSRGTIHLIQYNTVMHQFECVRTARVDGSCVSIAASAQAVVVSRQFNAVAYHPGRAAEYATNPEFSEWGGDNENGPCDPDDEVYFDPDQCYDGDLVVLTPDTLQQVRVIGSAINPLGAFRFWKASYYSGYKCGLAFEPLEGLLLVADSCNGAVHVINVQDGTHVGFAATPRLCENYVCAVTVKQTSSTSCVAAIHASTNILLVSHRRGGRWDPVATIPIFCRVNVLHFHGAGLSFVCADDASLFVFTQSSDDPLHFERAMVSVPPGSGFLKKVVRLSEKTMLFACMNMHPAFKCLDFEHTAVTCLLYGSSEIRTGDWSSSQFHPCTAEWFDFQVLEWAHVPTAGLVSVTQKFPKDYTSSFVEVSRFVAVMSLHRLAWMSACARACEMRARSMRLATAHRQCKMQ